MSKQIPVDDSALAQDVDERGAHQILPDLAYKRLAIVNVAFYGAALGHPKSDDWVLIDAGMPGTGGAIVDAVENRFGEKRPPIAIVLTHGHFDHVGALGHLAELWSVPIYAH